MEDDAVSVCWLRLAVDESDLEVETAVEGMVWEKEIMEDLAVEGLLKIRQDCCDNL